jgi:hypothetical protein
MPLAFIACLLRAMRGVLVQQCLDFGVPLAYTPKSHFALQSAINLKRALILA